MSVYPCGWVNEIWYRVGRDEQGELLVIVEADGITNFTIIDATKGNIIAHRNNDVSTIIDIGNYLHIAIVIVPF